MSAYRPYVVEETFRYPLEAGKKALEHNLSQGNDSGEVLDFLDFDELVAGQSQLSAVGLSVSRFYSRMLVSQPFEVARFLLQVGEWDSEATPTYEDYDFRSDASSSSDEEVDYFVDVRDMAKTGNDQRTSHAAFPTTRKRVKPSRQRGVQLFRPQVDSAFPESMRLAGGPYIFGVMGAVSDKEGVFGMWRALNASCLCRAATGVAQAWVTSLLASICGVPDPQFVEILQAANPLRLVAVGTAACAISAALLVPLFIIRARLIATSMTVVDRPRSLRWSLLDLVRRAQLFAPYWVIAPSVLAATIQHAFQACAPLLLWRVGGIDAFATPQLYRGSQLCANLLSLSIKMPLETMASRAQLRASHPSARTLIVKPANYQGILPTLWDVIKGTVPLASLYRGWRSEVVGILGEWGYDALDDRPTQQERF